MPKFDLRAEEAGCVFCDLGLEYLCLVHLGIGAVFGSLFLYENLSTMLFFIFRMRFTSKQR